MARRTVPRRGGGGVVVVVGSVNMDLVIRAQRRPAAGETLMGGELRTIPGGKGSNQAAAAGQMMAGGCRMIARVGRDGHGQSIVRTLQAQHVTTAGILVDPRSATGVAMIVVDDAGENSILLSPGANARLSVKDIAQAKGTIARARVLVVQLEVPARTVAAALRIARAAGVLTILDPAPAPLAGLAAGLRRVDIITPNQSEAELLTGIAVRNVADARRAGERLVALGARLAVIKMGADGALAVGRGVAGGAVHVPGVRVKVVDTTAAGDCFTGALAAALAEGADLPDAVRFANAAGALACTRLGAQTSIPTRRAVDALLGRAKRTN